MGLVLTRKSGERVMLSNDIVVTVLEGRRAGQVRLHITAPANIKIWREELTHVRGVFAHCVGEPGDNCHALGVVPHAAESVRGLFFTKYEEMTNGN